MIVVSAMTEFKSIIIDNKVKEEHARWIGLWYSEGIVKEFPLRE
jgi:hypothetical protein